MSVGREILSLRLRGKYGLEYFEKKVLRKCFDPVVKKKLHKDKLRN
jgi:hypothetical protein